MTTTIHYPTARQMLRSVEILAQRIAAASCDETRIEAAREARQQCAMLDVAARTHPRRLRAADALDHLRYACARHDPAAMLAQVGRLRALFEAEPRDASAHEDAPVHAVLDDLCSASDRVAADPDQLAPAMSLLERVEWCGAGRPARRAVGIICAAIADDLRGIADRDDVDRRIARVAGACLALVPLLGG